MELVLKRTRTNGQAVIGQLTIKQHPEFFCYTLEREEVMIPKGEYPVTLYLSPKLRYNVPLLHNVHKRTMIQIHAGNYPRDTDGCILVGKQAGISMIMSSKHAFEELMSFLKEPATITVS